LAGRYPLDEQELLLAARSLGLKASRFFAKAERLTRMGPLPQFRRPRQFYARSMPQLARVSGNPVEPRYKNKRTKTRVDGRL
jgi:hypothetical protein